MLNVNFPLRAAEAAAAEYLRAKDMAAGIYPPNFTAGLSGLALSSSMPMESRRNSSLSAALDFKPGRHKLTSDLTDLIPPAIPHVDSDPNLSSSSTAFNFPQQLPFPSFGGIQPQEQLEKAKH